MLRLLLRYALGSSLLLVLPLWLIRAQPHDNQVLAALLTLPEDCAAPCFMGIRPGTTTMEQALSILQTHPWAEVVQQGYPRHDIWPRSGFRDLSWTWSDAVSDEIDTRYPGTIVFVDSGDATVVEFLRIHTRLPLPLVEASLGTALGGALTWESGTTALRYWALYSVEPDQRVIGVTTLIPCPFNLLNYGYSQAELILTAQTFRYGGPYHSPTEVAALC